MALTKDRNTPSRSGDQVHLAVAGGVQVFAGALVAINAAGFVLPGKTATGLRAVGRAISAADNRTGADGDVFVEVQRGCFRYGNSEGSDEITASDLTRPCFIVDDETVAKTDGESARSPAGVVVDVDSTGVWVEVGLHALSAD